MAATENQRPKQHNMLRKRGDTKGEKFRLREKKTKAIRDITGYTFILTVNTEQYPVDATNKVFDIVGVIIDAADGKFEFVPTAGNADNVGNYYYDVEMTDAAGRLETILEGTYVVEEDISK